VKPGTHVPYTDADRRYWRSRGNRRVRKKRWARWTVRWTVLALVHLLVLALIAVVSVRVVRHLSATDEFALAEIRIEGLARTSDEEIVRRLQHHFHASLLDLDLEEIARTLEQDPWIRRAAVRRVLPRSLDVHLEERVPVARVDRPDGPLWVDGRAVLLPPRGDAGIDALPWILGARDGDLTLARARVREALDVLGAIHAAAPEWYAELDSIELRRDAVVARTAGGDRVLLDRDGPARNLTSWLALRAEIGRRVGATASIDLRWRGRVTVLPAALPASRSLRNAPASSRPGR
jgi:cell division septal protein FtsQ